MQPWFIDPASPWQQWLSDNYIDIRLGVMILSVLLVYALWGGLYWFTRRSYILIGAVPCLWALMSLGYITLTVAVALSLVTLAFALYRVMFAAS